MKQHLGCVGSHQSTYVIHMRAFSALHVLLQVTTLDNCTFFASFLDASTIEDFLLNKMPLLNLCLPDFFPFLDLLSLDILIKHVLIKIWKIFVVYMSLASQNLVINLKEFDHGGFLICSSKSKKRGLEFLKEL